MAPKLGTDGTKTGTNSTKTDTDSTKTDTNDTKIDTNSKLAVTGRKIIEILRNAGIRIQQKISERKRKIARWINRL